MEISELLLAKEPLLWRDRCVQQRHAITGFRRYGKELNVKHFFFTL